MAKRSRMPRDTNQLAASIVAKTTGTDEPEVDEDDRKDPAAVALGRKGGLKFKTGVAGALWRGEEPNN